MVSLLQRSKFEGKVIKLSVTEKLPLIFSHEFDGRIWQIVPAGRDRLMLEIRNEEKGQVSLFAYGKGNITAVATPELPYWSTLLSAGPFHVVVREFGEGGRAEQMTLTGIDVSTGRVQWKMEKVRVLALEDEQALILHDEEEKRISLRSGLPVTEKPGAGENNLLLPPFHYPEGSSHFETVRKFILGQTGEHILAAADYREYGDRIIMAYYVRQGDTMINKVLVTTTGGQLLMTEILAENLLGITDISYLIFQGNLIFVQGSDRFLHYALSD